MASISNGMVTLPSGIQGYSYIVVTNATDMSMMDSGFFSYSTADPADLYRL